jgi:hypothetical protein
VLDEHHFMKNSVKPKMKLKFYLQRCCSKDVAAKMLQQRCCSKDVAAKMLQQRCCSKDAAAKMLQQRCCSKDVAAKMLQQRCCSKDVAAKMLQQRCPCTVNVLTLNKQKQEQILICINSRKHNCVEQRHCNDIHMFHKYQST